MSYSDYGGFAWKNGERFRDAEDGTVIGQVAPTERPLEAVTGLKLDVLRPYYIKYKEEAQTDRNYLLEHPHHVVLGGPKGPCLVGHKRSITVLWNGEKVDQFPSYDGDYEIAATEKRGLEDGWKWAAKYVEYPHSNGCLMYLRSPDGVVLSGVVGYGVGDHWWKDNQGRESLRPGDRYETRPGIEGWYWDSGAAEEDRAAGKTEENMGFRPQEPWPTYEEWEQRVREWVATL